MVRPELLAPAGSFDAAIAAVSNGADAIYLGYGDFNARRSAKNFSREELLEVVSYCRARGVKTHVTLNTLVTDRELVELEEVVRFLNNIGVDALIVADLGAARLIRAIAPDMPIHASTQLTVHNIAGVRAAERAGFSRVVLARELDAASIRHICKEAKIEIEVFAHGALCMCYSGQCLMSSVIGQRSGNRGMCAQPCRLPYKVDDARTSTNPLSLKDLCLVDNLAELSSIGVASLKIEGRMKRPEYVAIVTGIYSQVLREGRVATAEEHARLREIFSRDGFTDAYYTGERDLMFGTRMEGDTEQLNAIYKAARVSYERETPRIPVSFCIDIRGGEAANLSAEDDAGNRVEISGPMPEPARTHALDGEEVREKLKKTGGTPFFVKQIDVNLGDGLSLAVSALNAMRRDALSAIISARSAAPMRRNGDTPSVAVPARTSEKSGIVVSALRFSQITDAMTADFFYLPLSEVAANPEAARALSERVRVGVIVPRIVWDDESASVLSELKAAFSCGIRDALVGNIGQIAPVAAEGFAVHGDIGLNAFNSRAAAYFSSLGLASLALSPELSFAQIRDIVSPVPTEIQVYGRLPLMLCENCIVPCNGEAAHSLTDRVGKSFPVMCEPHHCNAIYNADILYLADKKDDYANLGLSFIRIAFTDEPAATCARILNEYQNEGGVPCDGFTRGLYYRGVE